MAHFLLVYDRSAGQLLRKTQYETGTGALVGRFEAEREFSGRPQIEIVALSAASEEDLLRTHGRYFFGLDELASRMN